jgi:hypothetical protein
MAGSEPLYAKAVGYIQKGMDKVQGFLEPLDCGLFLALDLAQKANGVAGDLAEIGVLHGRSAFLLHHFLRPGERLRAIDIYDLYYPDPPFNGPDAIIGNALAMGLDLAPFDFIKADTTKSAPLVKDKVGAGTVRMFHVDGDHRLRNILADAEIALAATRQDGVIVFDDTFAHLMPEVTEGVIRTFLGRKDFLPLALTPGKTWFCGAAMKGLYARYLIECLPANLDNEVRRFLDDWVLTFSRKEGVTLCHTDKVTANALAALKNRIEGRSLDLPIPP